MRDLTREILGENGPVAKFLGSGYEPREEQLAMAKAVSQTLASKGILIAEAGTGVGKSYAYLVPAILRCIANGERVVIATHTINLQEQLLRKDIPLLQDTLGNGGPGGGWGLDPKTTVELSPVLVKGRGNYISRRRLKMAGDRSDRLLDYGAEQRSLKTIQDWVETTPDGTLSTLPQLERYGVWDRVQSDTDNCMGRKCPTYQSCFYQKARREMEKGNLLVCNHAVFFADLKLRGSGENAGFLPPYQHVILDEAHTLEDVASDHFGLSLTESRIERYLGTLYNAHTQRGYLNQGAFAAVAQEGGGNAHDLLDNCVQGVAHAHRASRAFFEGLLRLARSGTLRNGRIASPDLLEPADDMVNALKSLSGRLRVLRDSIKSEEDRFELNAYAVRADAAAFDADVLGGQKQQGCVYWVEGAGTNGSGGEGDTGGEWGGVGRGGQRRPTAKLKLACSPIEVGPILRERLFNQKLGVVLTSATLATSAESPHRKQRPKPIVIDTERRIEPVDDGAPHEAEVSTVAPPVVADPFDHCRKRLGIEAAATLQLGSPFDYRTQAKVIVDTSVPDARGGGEAYTRYLDVLGDRLLHHVDATDGGAFVLFTSFAVLNACADRLGPRLALRAYPLLVQGRDGPPARILETFRQSERSVLFGAASFWQGVDVRGDTLRNVIITKLPFDPPDRPLVEARCDLIKARGGDPFKEESLPRALLRFRQGFGRLIRSKTDVGQVVILDARVVSTGYGRIFLRALPAGVPVETLRPPRQHAGVDDGTDGH